jgi:hypothetical protein
MDCLRSSAIPYSQEKDINELKGRKMKKLIFLLFVMTFFTASGFGQKPAEGMTEFTLGGTLFKNYSEAKIHAVSPDVGVGYFFSPAIEAGGALHILKYGGSGAAIGDFDKFSCTLDINGKYHFLAQEKIWPYLGAHINFGLGDGPLGKLFGDSPVVIGATIGVKYWPMPGGAMFAELAWDKRSPSSIKETTLGFNLGILIRLK